MEKKFIRIRKRNQDNCAYISVWANFALGPNSVKGKARPNVLCEWIRTSEDDQPRNG